MTANESVPGFRVRITPSATKTPFLDKARDLLETVHEDLERTGADKPLGGATCFCRTAGYKTGCGVCVVAKCDRR